MKTILFITREYPPAVCGVADHTARLLEELARNGWTCRVLTTTQEATGPGVFYTKSFGKGLAERVKSILREESIDAICWQYVPYSYQQKGLPFWWPGEMRKLAKTGIKQYIFFHEVSLRTRGYGWKQALAAIGQRRIANRAATYAAAVFTSIPLYASYFHTKKPLIVPISANILPCQPEPRSLSAVEGRQPPTDCQPEPVEGQQPPTMVRQAHHDIGPGNQQTETACQPRSLSAVEAQQPPTNCQPELVEGRQPPTMVRQAHHDIGLGNQQTETACQPRSLSAVEGRQPPTDCQPEPVEGQQLPTTNCQPSTGNLQPATGNLQPATGNSQPVSGNPQLENGNLKPASSNCQLPTTNCQLSTPSLFCFANRCTTTLLQAVADLQEATPCTLVLGGQVNEAMKSRLQAAAGELGIGDSVVFTGTLETGELAACMGAATMYVQPQIVERENEGGVSAKNGTVMAAMAAGKAIITCRGDMTDPALFGEGKNMLFVPYNDAAAWQAAIKDLLSDVEKRKVLGKAARYTYEQFCSWPVTSQKIMDEILRTL